MENLEVRSRKDASNPKILSVLDDAPAAGTSAGASVVCETMLTAGTGRTSPRLGESIQMAPCLGVIRNMIIDQHFAECGRMGRLLAAVAQNPRTLGLGIDENTAVVIDCGESFYVVGTGAVYAVKTATSATRT